MGVHPPLPCAVSSFVVIDVPAVDAALWLISVRITTIPALTAPAHGAPRLARCIAHLTMVSKMTSWIHFVIALGLDSGRCFGPW